MTLLTGTNETIFLHYLLIRENLSPKASVDVFSHSLTRTTLFIDVPDHHGLRHTISMTSLTVAHHLVESTTRTN